ncbi:hypothetical protein ACOZ4I_20450 (plasmid) [Haloarcula salina]|uniref:hypothetical protein n=1 Tax=Haloarcula salina TaxID=1429914 RepID=UPI003C6F8DF7
MTRLPYPPEPSHKTLKKYGDAYDKGMADFWGHESIDEDSVAKQSMIEYLFDQWDHESISRNEVAKACGAANTPIEQWYNGKAEWGDVMKRVESALGTPLK